MNMDLELKMMLERIENDKKHNERKRRLEKQKEREKIRKLKDRLAKIDDEAKSSVLFNAINLTKIIAELISDKEKQPYEPLILDVHFSNGFSRKIFIISKSENKEDICCYQKEFYSEETINFCCDNYYSIYIGSICYEDTHEKEFNSDHNLPQIDLTFSFLLYEQKIQLPVNNDCIESMCKFLGYEYIKNFVEYLFELQFKNNGKQLSYEEMHQAMIDFTMLRKKSLTQKKLIMKKEDKR